MRRCGGKRVTVSERVTQSDRSMSQTGDQKGCATRLMMCKTEASCLQWGGSDPSSRKFARSRAGVFNGPFPRIPLHPALFCTTWTPPSVTVEPA